MLLNHKVTNLRWSYNELHRIIINKILLTRECKMNLKITALATVLCLPFFAAADDKPLVTTITSKFKDDRITVDHDTVGLGAVRIDISKVADVVTDDKGVVRAKKTINIKASPGDRGQCVDTMTISPGERIPRLITLDTRLCTSIPIDMTLIQ